MKACLLDAWNGWFERYSWLFYKIMVWPRIPALTSVLNLVKNLVVQGRHCVSSKSNLPLHRLNNLNEKVERKEPSAKRELEQL